MSTTKTYRRIATEEAFSIPEQMNAMRELIAKATDHDPDLALWRSISDAAGPVHRQLLDLEGERLRIMDRDGVSMHLLSLTSTGVQMLDPDRAAEVAVAANDQLAAVIQRHPHRFAGLATVPPQDPRRAIAELERAIRKLRLNGVIINSHTNGEYLSEEKYWPILEAVADLDVPLYIHPRSPIPAMAPAYRRYELEGAIWGFQADTSLHALHLIISGVFDRIPKLKVVLGHMGEGLPFWLYRLDYMHGFVRMKFTRPQLKQRLSDYFKQNFLITTSGMNWDPALQFCISVLGADNIMWAIDYPYQESGEATEFMNRAPISEEDREKIFHRNAERVFRIAPAG